VHCICTKFLGTAVLIGNAYGEVLEVALKQMPNNNNNNNNNSEIISVVYVCGFAQPCSFQRDIFPS
jgi:glycerol uptake facilitator-like aquaporin